MHGITKPNPFNLWRVSAMDVLGANLKKNTRRPAKRSKKAVKVVYISSPLKVKISASEFRARVQELTGKNSDTARLMDFNGTDDQTSSPETLDRRIVNHDHSSMFDLSNSFHESPNYSSDSVFVESFDGFLPSVGESFMSMLQSNFFNESSAMGMLK